MLLDVNHAFFGVLGAKALLKVAEQTVDARRLLLDRVERPGQGQAQVEPRRELRRGGPGRGPPAAAPGAGPTCRRPYAQLATALGLADAAPRDAGRGASLPGCPPDDVDELSAPRSRHDPSCWRRGPSAEAAQKLAAAEKAAQYPVVSAVGAVGFSPYRDDRLTSTYAAAGVNVSLPVFTGGRLSARAEEAQLQAERRREGPRRRGEPDRARRADRLARRAHRATRPSTSRGPRSRAPAAPWSWRRAATTSASARSWS